MPDPVATLILTRPRAGSERFLADLGDAVTGAVRVVISPLLDIVPTGQVPDYRDVRGVVFTSANGVRFGGPGLPLPAFCVGPATTAAAAEAGWIARQSGDTADDLVAALQAERPKAPLLHVAGIHRRGDVSGRLTAAGLETGAVDVYDQVTLPLSAEADAALRATDPVIVPLFSPRAARHFAEVARPRAPLHVVGMSEAVLAETAELDAVARVIAPRPDAQSMGDTVANLLRRVEAGHAPQ